MDKEKEIEEMARVMCPTAEYITCDRCVAKKCTPQMYATILDNAGYGNVKQAVKDFAENIIELLDEMGMERSSEYNDGYDDGVADCITNIKSRITELYGEDDK